MCCDFHSTAKLWQSHMDTQINSESYSRFHTLQQACKQHEQQPVRRPFFQVHPDEPVAAETLTHSHPVFVPIIQHFKLTLFIFYGP